MTYPFEDEPEPAPTQTLLVPWDVRKLRRTVEREEWIGCWRMGTSGYLEFFSDGSARQKFVYRGVPGDFEGAIHWEWVDSRAIRVRHEPGHGGSGPTDAQYRVIRFDGKKIWTECLALDGPAAGIELTVFFVEGAASEVMALTVQGGPVLLQPA